MRIFLAGLLLSAFSLIPVSASADNTQPELYGVMFYADWCGSCKTLDPKLTAAREAAALDETDVLFVRLDLTDATTKHQAALLAAALDIENIYQQNDGKTGYLALIDTETGDIVKRLYKTMSHQEIATAIKAELASAASPS